MPASPLTKAFPYSHESNVEAEGIRTAETRTSGEARARSHEIGKKPLRPTPLSIDLAQTWLTWQCRMIAGIIRGALFLPVDAERIGSAISTWPGGGGSASQLIDAATQALAENRGVARSLQKYGPENRRTCDLVACPLLVDDKPVAVVTVMISPRSESQQHAVLQLLQWGGLWMETLIHQQSAVQREAGAFSLTLMTAILGHSSSHTATMETVNRMAEQFGCERVSMGFRRGPSIRLQSLSHVANFDPRTQLVRGIEAAMEEAVDQTTTMIQPRNPDRDSAVTRAHAELAEQQGNGAVCTIPLSGRSGAIGAITLERGACQPFAKGTVDWCESLAGLIGPVLELKQREERSSWSKGIEALLELAAGVCGPARLKLKVAVLSAMALVTVLSFSDGNYRVTAPASIEGAVRQILVAPRDGYVKQAEARAGDLVNKGQLIVSLDDRNPRLERQKWRSERNKLEKEYQNALAKHDRTELSVLRAQIDQVDAELRLVGEEIARLQMHAPFTGVVVSGDLSQSLGAPVETGQVLFEVASLDRYRVVLEVDEQDVAGLDSGKSGHLIIAALPQTSFAISLDQVVPVAVSGEASNFFRVEASLEESSPLLRPGMRGVAKVEMGQRNLLWIWTHSVIDRIRLWIWSAGF